MKHKLLFLASFFLFAVSVSAQWTKPEIYNFEEMIDDGSTTQYLYNVGVHKFFVGHNEWNTRASVDDYGDPIRITKLDGEEGYYDFGCYPSKYRTDINAWKSVSGKTWNDMWCDGEEGNSTYLGVKMWVITKVGDFLYKFSNDNFNQEYEFGPTEATLGVADYVNGQTGDTRLYLYYQHTVTVTKHFEEGDEDVEEDCFQGNFYDEWMFVSENVYNDYVERIDLYSAATSLKVALDDAEANYPGINLDAQKAVYNNPSSTVEELKAAEAEITGIIIEYLATQEVDINNPVDFSGSIENPTFDVIGDFHGWSFGEGTKQFDAGGDKSTCAEVWRGSFDGYQMIENLPEGVYMLVCNGYCRYNDDHTADYSNWKAGNPSNTLLYTTTSTYGTFSTNVKCISEGGSQGVGIGGAGNHVTAVFTDDDGNEYQDELYTPNTMVQANDYFHDTENPNRYRNEVICAVAEGDPLRIGVKSAVESDWNVFDDFQLFYFGNKVEAYQYWGQKISENCSVNLDGAFYGQPDKDAYDETINVLKNSTTKEDIIASVKKLGEVTENLEKSQANYKAFIEAYNEAFEWLVYATENMIEGEYVDKLADYLQASAEDWFDGMLDWDYPHGVVNAFLDLENNATVGTLNADEIAEETRYMQEMKELAIKHGMVEGSDVTDLLVNAKCDGTFDGWTYKEGKVGEHNLECYYQVVDVYQEVKNVSPGIYSISVNAFERPGENGTYNGSEPSKVFLFMNQFQTPVQNICKDALQDEECNEDVNCYRGSQNGQWPYDYNVEAFGWVPNSVHGADIAFTADRYKQTCYGLVGDDGLMKVGLTSNGEVCHWVLWANFRLKYMGKNIEAMQSVINDYLLKIEEITDPYGTPEHTALNNAIQAAENASTPDDMYDALFDIVDAYNDALASAKKYKEAQDAMVRLNDALSEYYDLATEEAREAATSTYNKYEDGVLSNFTYSIEELDDIIEEIEIAIAQLKLPDYSDASDDNPIDFTGLIINPDYDNGDDDGWEGTTKSHNSFQLQDMSEYWRASFDHHQTLRTLPEGTYELTLNCFNRLDDDAKSDLDAFESGLKLEKQTAFVYAIVGDQTFAEPFYLASEPLRTSWTLDGSSASATSSVSQDTYYLPNDMEAANAAFTETDDYGEPLSDVLNYRVRVVFTLDKASDVTIGCKNSVTSSWAIWDSWRLTYFGTNSEKTDSHDATAVESLSTDNLVATEIYTVGGARIQTMQRGLNIVKMSDGSFRKVFVK